ncbi:hypothetical protein [Silvimonas soli]|uniref:hypothetical protein n=1 Tax=Silvimonas soli TaxID=2980100 RepID=UPI0024B37B3B|nr:hypothetical protein [Silvimonas soli]
MNDWLFVVCFALGFGVLCALPSLFVLFFLQGNQKCLPLTASAISLLDSLQSSPSFGTSPARAE